jgi:hypothetical protein
MNAQPPLLTRLLHTDLPRAESIAELGQGSFGRIAITDGALPFILPVNYSLDGSSIVFHAKVGSRLHRACRGTIVAFEVDDFDAQQGVGWSVVVLGVATVFPPSDPPARGPAGGADPSVGEETVRIGIVPGRISGRIVEQAGLPAAAGACWWSSGPTLERSPANP